MTPLVFDIVVGAVIVVSAVMSLGRGLIREAFSVVAFAIGGVSALACLIFLQKPLAAALPALPDWALGPILVVVGFLVAYILAAVIGGRLSKLIHASPEIGVLDRLAGGAFGVARGFLGMILFVLLVQQLLPDNTPDYISKSHSYAVLNPAASWIRQTVPGFVKCADAVANGSTECVKNQKSGQ